VELVPAVIQQNRCHTSERGSSAASQRLWPKQAWPDPLKALAAVSLRAQGDGAKRMPGDAVSASACFAPLAALLNRPVASSYSPCTDLASAFLTSDAAVS